MKTLIVVIALVALLPSLALAHAQLASSMPADRQSLQSPPKDLMLHFTEAVRLTALTIARDGGGSTQVDSLPAGVMTDFSVPAPALQAGRYSVSWRAVSADSHVMSGTFTFTVGAASPAADAARGHAGHAQH
jgi:copper transport protein